MRTPTPITDREEAIQTQRYGCMMVKSEVCRQMELANIRLRSELEKMEKEAVCACLERDGYAIQLIEVWEKLDNAEKLILLLKPTT